LLASAEENPAAAIRRAHVLPHRIESIGAGRPAGIRRPANPLVTGGPPNKAVGVRATAISPSTSPSSARRRRRQGNLATGSAR